MGASLHQLSLSLLLVTSFTLFSDVQPVLAAPPEQPLSCSVGIYLLSLQDFNVAERSFGADFWVWTNCPTNFPDALEKMDFVNSKEINTSLDSGQQKGNIYWSTRKVQGVFKQDWNISNFPFDRHVLKIEIEHGILDATQFVYKPDNNNSRYQKTFQLAGWKITDFSMQQNTKEYETTYGDPTLATTDGSKFSHIDVLISLQRSSLIGFFKLTTVVYIAVGITFAIYLVNVSSDFEVRMSTLIGALFAIVINQQVTNSTLGETEGLMLVDKIHITAMVYVLAAVVVTIISYRDCEKGKKQIALRRDRLSCYISVISFIVINLILIGYGAMSG